MLGYESNMNWENMDFKNITKKDIYSGTGFFVVIAFGLYALVQLFRIYIFFPKLSPSVHMTYISLFMVPIGTLLYLYSTKDRRSKNRRSVDHEEVETLFNEAELYKANDELLSVTIRGQIDRLTQIDQPSELDVVPLRQLLVDLYPTEVLISKSSYELELYWEYVIDDYESEQKYDDWVQRINDKTKICENSKGKECASLRAELKTLREKVGWFDKTWAEGEVITNSVSYWAWISLFSTFLLGVLPLVHSQGSDLLNILHWGSLGCAGALASVLLYIRETDVTEVGEQEGKQIITRTVVNTAIGAIAAMLLYAALSGGIIAGKIFPQKIQVNVNDSDFWINTGLSVFWGITAGFSTKIFSRLIGIAESSFGKEDSN